MFTSSSAGKRIHKCLYIQRRRNSSSNLYIAGHGWTGTFGTGPQTITSPATSYVSEEERENGFKPIHIFDESNVGKIVDGAAGWGHTVVLCKGADENDVKMYVAGRPYDFQPLLRLNRLPSFIRRVALSLSLTLDQEIGWGRGNDSRVTANDDNKNNDDKEEEEKPNPLAKFRNSVFPSFERIKLPNNDIPLINTDRRTLVASAGFSGIIGKSGNAYMFGLNRSGQCGVGDKDLIHIWEPTPLKLPGSAKNAVTDLALGLQHGLMLDDAGKIYTWGKASRGQLGISEDVRNNMNSEDDLDSKSDFEFSPIHIDLKEETNLSDEDSIVKRIGTGWNHSAVVTQSNDVWIWGKNVLIDESNGAKKAVDAVSPVLIKGLPDDMEVVDISCGSHHTSILVEDGSVYARGIATDTKEPIGGDTVFQIIPPGLIDMPVKQFKSHFDRTTIVAGENGCQVLEVQLWSSEELRNEAVFEPAWVEKLLSDCNGIEFVHRGWHHTVVAGNKE